MNRSTNQPINRSTAVRAFTLVELIVVVAIIALLIAILLPSMNSAYRLAKETSCASQLHQRRMRRMHRRV